MLKTKGEIKVEFRTRKSHHQHSTLAFSARDEERECPTSRTARTGGCDTGLKNGIFAVRFMLSSSSVVLIELGVSCDLSCSAPCCPLASAELTDQLQATTPTRSHLGAACFITFERVRSSEERSSLLIRKFPDVFLF